MSTIFIDKHGITREKDTGQFADKPGAKPYFDLVDGGSADDPGEVAHWRQTGGEAGRELTCPVYRLDLAASHTGLMYRQGEDNDPPNIRLTFQLRAGDDASDAKDDAALTWFRAEADTIIAKYDNCSCHTCDGIPATIKADWGEMTAEEVQQCQEGNKYLKEELMNWGKKAGAASMIGALAFSLAACGAQASTDATPTDQGPSVTDQAETVTALEGEREGHQAGDVVGDDDVDAVRAQLAGTGQVVVLRDGQYVVANGAAMQAGDVVDEADLDNARAALRALNPAPGEGNAVIRRAGLDGTGRVLVVGNVDSFEAGDLIAPEDFERVCEDQGLNPFPFYNNWDWDEELDTLIGNVSIVTTQGNDGIVVLGDQPLPSRFIRPAFLDGYTTAQITGSNRMVTDVVIFNNSGIQVTVVGEPNGHSIYAERLPEDFFARHPIFNSVGDAVQWLEANAPEGSVVIHAFGN